MTFRLELDACGDIRDGINFGFGVDTFASIHSEGNSYKSVIQNMKIKARNKKGSERLLNAFQRPHKLVMGVLDTLGINIELKGIWFTVDAKISYGIGTGATFKCGWTDTSGYQMVGVGGVLKVGGDIGLGLFAGIHESGSRVKVQIGCAKSHLKSSISFVMIVALDNHNHSDNNNYKIKSNKKNKSPVPIIERSIPIHQWRCKRCTFLNHADLLYCAVKYVVTQENKKVYINRSHT
eukprot:759267_1